MGFIESDLTWAPNAKEDRTGPKYRLFSEKDVRHVLPNTQYNCKQICSTYMKCICVRYIEASISTVWKLWKFTDLGSLIGNF